MKKIVLLTILVIALLMLTGCGYRLNQGTVVDKSYTPPQTYTRHGLMHVGQTLIPTTRKVHRPAQYQLKVMGTDAKDTMVCEWWDVSQEKYETTEIGDWTERK